MNYKLTQGNHTMCFHWEGDTLVVTTDIKVLGQELRFNTMLDWTGVAELRTILANAPKSNEFAPSSLGVLAYTNGMTIWSYKRLDCPLASLLAPGYFDKCVDMLAHGDFILVSGRDGGKLAYVRETDPQVVLGPAT